MLILKMERLQREWSQAELARRSALNPNTISQIESGRFIPYAIQLKRLAVALGWPAEDAEQLLEEVPSPMLPVRHPGQT